MIALIIVGGIILLLVLILFLPFCIDVLLDGDFFMTIRVLGIKVYSIKPESDIKRPKKADVESDKKAEKQQIKFFEKLKNKLGFVGAIKEIVKLALDIIQKIKLHLKHILIKNIELNVVIATDNAFDTALQYGEVCTVLYPLVSFIDTLSNVKFKKINLTSDFQGNKPSFKFKTRIKIKLFWLLKLGMAAFIEYKKFSERNGL